MRRGKAITFDYQKEEEVADLGIDSQNKVMFCIWMHQLYVNLISLSLEIEIIGNWLE